MNNRAFTLIELSVVLVIISLIIGGISFGYSLVKNYQTISIINEVNQYRSAVYNFKLKYNALPGDMTNASSFWPNCTVNDGGSCDGNGDGIIGVKGNYYWQGTYNNNESLRAWQHLSLAEIIVGNYSGYGYNNSQTAKFDFNTPRSKYPNSGYSFYGDGCYALGTVMYLMLSGPISPSNSIPYSVTPIDAYNIDNKLDDGYPKVGKIIARSSDGSELCGNIVSTNACVKTTNSSDSLGSYHLDNNGPLCLIYFSY